VGYVGAMLCLLLAHLAAAGEAVSAAAFLAYAAAHPPAAHPEPAYHFAEDVYAALAPIVAHEAGVVTPFVVGDTVRGEPIWGFRVADPGTPVTHKLLVFANIHALEWVPTEGALRFLEELAIQPPEGLAVTIIPVFNADGRFKVEEDLRHGFNTYRRGNWENVDLNRDFAVNREATAIWKAVIPNRYVTSPAPLSQPETRALDALAAAEHFDVAVSLHAFGGFIYYPWAGRWERAADWREMQALSVAMQAGMGAHAYRPRQLARWGFFFRGQGMELDHLYGTYGTRSFLVETTRSGINPLRGDGKSYFRWYNPRDPVPHARRVAGMLRALVVAMGEPLG
jgi:hypothetical protein